MVVASRADEEPGETAGKPAEGNPRLDEAKENTTLGIPVRRNVTRVVTKVRESGPAASENKSRDVKVSPMCCYVLRGQSL